MNNIWQRILLFVVTIPLLLIIILFIPWAGHLTFYTVVAVFCILGARETRGLFAAAQFQVPPLIPFLTLLFPLNFYCLGMGWYATDLTMPLFIFLTVVIMVFQLRGSDFSHALHNTSASVLVLIYPGLLLAYAGRLSNLPDSQWIVLLFLGLVMGNDTLAYVVGKLFGKKTKGILKVSPGKSLIGFIGGLGGSLLFALLFYFLRPSIFSGHISIALLLALICGLLTIIGDLIESALKRSAGVKDSGTLIPGRGGVLDSVDSLSITAPAIYYILNLLTQL